MPGYTAKASEASLSQGPQAPKFDRLDIETCTRGRIPQNRSLLGWFKGTPRTEGAEATSLHDADGNRRSYQPAVRLAIPRLVSRRDPTGSEVCSNLCPGSAFLLSRHVRSSWPIPNGSLLRIRTG
ncbi:LOW QUALITY PROTEIN: hypothetical protein CVT26_009071 [Gymnopilus dilepis]|uniref:Uncharacterized protein n=1 Tax=Gymnopilus dilepis TaxID=231916 RepID=A0A409YR39_9AGAR|nr:LOW QUALITY PROTEIN: hypothetical protein CVT26_009071 [Gymnopilus dilepis]